jgi:hypothetical protein
MWKDEPNGHRKFEHAKYGKRITLLITRDGDRFDFNGHKFDTQAEAEAFVEAYLDKAAQRHGWDKED